MAGKNPNFPVVFDLPFHHSELVFSYRIMISFRARGSSPGFDGL